MRNIIVALVLSGLLGCGPAATPPNPAEKDKAGMVKLLPPNHTNLTDLGNHWYTYNLEVGGKKRLFMVCWWNSSNGGWTGMTITELQGN